MILRERQEKYYQENIKIEKYEYLTVEEILPSDESRMIEEAIFTYPPLEKALERQTKNI